jgi:hypothetical protein
MSGFLHDFITSSAYQWIVFAAIAAFIWAATRV